MADLPSGFLAGVNLPWLDYGCDFGANAWQPEGGLARPERRERLRPVLARLVDEGIRYLRWFWLCDGRAGLRGGGHGLLPELDERVLRDVDSSLDLLRDHGLRVMPVLLSFDWFGRAQHVGGVRLRGRRALASARERRGHLVQRVFAPLLERGGRSEAVFAWDLMNEPEWATLAMGSHDPTVSLRRSVMRAFLGELLDCARARVAQPITVGLAGPRGLPLVEGLGLDFYQVHWYDRPARRPAPQPPLLPLGLDRPVVLGEFPTRASAYTTAGLLDGARRAGFAGAFAWSALAADEFSAGPQCGAEVAAWVRGTPGPLLA